MDSLAQLYDNRDRRDLFWCTNNALTFSLKCKANSGIFANFPLDEL